MRTSNILDPVHDALDPAVWDAVHESHPVLKPQHKHWILDTIHDVLKAAGYGDMDKWLEVYLTGSLTTFQYSPESDCDVSLFVNTDVFPEWGRAEMIGVMVDNIDSTALPGTTHPMQCFVVAKGIRPNDLYKPGLRSGYLIKRDQWAVPPEKDRSHDVQREQSADYQYALECADKMDRLLRYEPDKAVTFWHQIHARRRVDQQLGKGDYSQSNIIYKFLNNRGLMPKLEEASGEHIAAATGWTPGNYGKFSITPEGEVHHWSVFGNPDYPDDGRPTHGEYMSEHMPERLQEYHQDGEDDLEKWTPGWIDPDGSASTIKGHEHRVKDHLFPAVPGTHFPKIAPTWESLLSKTAAFMPHPDRIEEARLRLGLKHPVRFMPTYKADLRGGYAGIKRDPQTDQDSHLIYFNPTQHPGAKNWAAWHELGHAMQHERGDEFHPTTDIPDQEYSELPKEAEAESIADQHSDLDLWHKHRTASEKPRVIYNKFRPEMTHPPTSLDRQAADHPFIYDPVDDIVHLGPPHSYHWELIQRTPELRAQYPMDKAYKEFSALSVPKHLHGRLEMPAKQTDFMGLTADNSHHRDAVNAALDATSKPQESWGSMFSHHQEGLNVGQIAPLPIEQTSAQEGRIRGTHRQAEALGAVSGDLWVMPEAVEAGTGDNRSHSTPVAGRTT